MILLNSTDSLQVLLAGTVTTNQCVLYAAYADMATDGSTFAPGAANGLTNNTTAVSWLSAPASDSVRQAKYLSLYNADTVNVTATVRINDGTNTRILCKATLATGERLEYSVDGGFRLIAASGASSTAVSDGDKGDITVTASGATWTVDNDAISYAKMQNVSATDRLLGRASAGAGDVEEITCTAFGRSLIDDANAAAARATLGVSGENIAEPVTALAASGTIAVDCALGDYFTLDATGNMTSFTFSNLPAAGKAQTIMIRIKQDATGSRIATFPASFDWAGGTVGVLTTTANAVDVLALTTFDQGTSWIATLSKAHS